jgi:hypothetical protein
MKKAIALLLFATGSIFAQLGSFDSEWYFTFCSTNSKTMPKLIAVGFNGKVIFDNGLR